MHEAALQWARQVWAAHPPPPHAHVLELGSYDVNGSARVLMAERPDIRWWGVDLRPGPGVNEIGDARWWRSTRRYEYVICMEMLEHTPEPERVIDTIIEQLAIGGRCIITCAGPTRAPHGCDGGPLPPGEHYANIHPNDLRRWLISLHNVIVRYNHAAGDVYATGVRR